MTRSANHYDLKSNLNNNILKMSSYSFLVTGGSSGIGLAVSLAALRSGHRVIATARNPSKSAKSHPELEKLGGSWLELDVTKPETEGTVKKTVEEQNVNVLVNSAGHALIGVVEDVSDAEIHSQFDTNFYGCLRTIKGVLPSFRTRKSGTIVNVSSGAGLIGRPGRGLYAASKFALEGVSESLSSELAPFNIRTIIVDLGAFGTNFASTVVTPESQVDNNGISKAYENTPAEEVLKATRALSGGSPGDADKAALRIVEFVTGTGMGEGEKTRGFLRLILGTDCLKAAKMKLKTFGENINAMEEVAPSTDR